MRKFLGIAAFAALLLGCVTPVVQFYKDLYAQMPENRRTDFILNEGEPKIYQYSANLKDDEFRLREDNYEILGYAEFNTANVSQDEILNQARQVKAYIAMVSSRFAGTANGAVPFTTYTTSTVSGDINATINTPSTTWIPYSVNRYDYLITFWAKRKPAMFGAYLSDLPVDLRQKLERNTGALVGPVRKGSPAFTAGIIPGDVLIKIGDTEIVSAAQYNQLMPSLAGTEVSMTLIRAGRTVEVKVQLNPLS